MIEGNSFRISHKGMEVRHYGYYLDREHTFTEKGTYTLKLICDSDDIIAETDETDNTYERTLNVSSADLPNLTPAKKDSWEDIIIVSNIKGTNSDGAVFENETSYIDVILTNNGKVDINTEIIINFYINDKKYATLSADNVAVGKYLIVEDFEYVFDSAGSAKLSIVIDPDNSISESDETDNTFEKYINVRAAEKPNLEPFKPKNWDDTIVVSDKPETNTQSSVFAGETSYIDFAFRNSGDVDIDQLFYIELWYQNRKIKQWDLDSLESWNSAGGTDIEYVFETAGTFTIELKLDVNNDINETDETDNTFQKLITISDNAKPNLRPFHFQDWEDIIVVSNKVDTHTNTQIYTDETAYIDYAYVNDGQKDITSKFYTELYINDKKVRRSYISDLEYGYAMKISDYKYTFTEPGTYTLKLITDCDNAIDESDETDNVYQRQITVESGGAPDIRIEPLKLEFGQNKNNGKRQNFSQNSVLQDRNIYLKSGTINPQKTKSLPAFPENRNHVLMQFGHLPTKAEQDDLLNQGIKLLTYIPNFTYWVSVDSVKLRTRNQKSIQTAGIKWIWVPAGEDKISEAVKSDKFPSNARYEDGSVRIHAKLFEDVSLKNAILAIHSINSTITVLEEQSSMKWLAIKTFPKDILSIAELDCVEWIEPASPPKTIMNEISAQRIKVDRVKTSLDLDGSGIIAAIWDGGSVYAHKDLGNRLTIKENNVPIDDHATHVAGTIAGSGLGNQSATGMATAAKIWSYDYYGNTIDEMLEAQQSGAMLSNHSWGYKNGWEYESQEWVKKNDNFGIYSVLSNEFDTFIHQHDWIFIKAAGNDRNDGPASCPKAGTDIRSRNRIDENTITQNGTSDQCDGPYKTIGEVSSTKNSIVVGATEDDDGMTNFSSWGPTEDGRIKPDVCANGDYLYSTMPDNQYNSKRGTSMAAPSVTGAAALLYQHFKNIENNKPSVELLKALMIHAAKDLGRPGPDYEFGFGLIDSEQSALLISEHSWDTDTIDSTGSEKIYSILVDDTVQEIKVTLVWTDPAGSPASQKALVNDLDMKLISPDNEIYLPYVLDKDNESRSAKQAENHIDNVEQIVALQPTPGDWSIVISGYAIPQGPQKFAIVTQGINNNSKNFTIFNDGTQPLNITQIQKENNEQWVSFFPDAPVTIEPGKQQVFTVSILTQYLNEDVNEERFLVYSNDPDSNPWPDGVYIQYGTGSNASSFNANNDTVQIFKNESTTIDVLANDNFIDSADVVITDTTEPEHGTVQITGNNKTIQYVPDTDFSGTDSFFYTLFNGVDSSQAKVSITVIDPDNQTTISYISTDTPLDIPDNDSNGLLSTISIPSGGKINDINVTINITHPSISDLSVRLISPAGTQIQLVDRIGDSNDKNFSNTIFDDQAQTKITKGQPPFTGSFQPVNSLSILNGELTEGDWQLKIVDSADGLEGRLLLWEVEIFFEAIEKNEPPIPQNDSAVTQQNAPVIINVLQNDTDPENGSLSITKVLKPTYGSTTLSEEGNNIIYHPAVDYVGNDSFNYRVSDGVNTVQASVSVVIESSDKSYLEYVSTDTPVNIPDNNPIGVLSKLLVTNSGTVEHLKVTLNISHDWSNDIKAYLISPGGTRVTLFENIETKGKNFIETTLDDFGGQHIENAIAPFTGSFIPKSPLNAFTSEVIGGEWQLHLIDTGKDDEGILNSWRLDILYASSNENRAPIAKNDVSSTAKEASVSIDILTNDYDLDQDVLKIKSFTQPENGTTYSSKRQDRIFYMPNQNFSGADMFTYTIDDDNGGQATAEVHVKVLGGGNIIQDGDFENGDNESQWVSASEIFDTNINQNTSVAHSGDWMIWFEGGDEKEFATVSQTLSIPQSEKATLRFWVRDYIDMAYAKTKVKIDNQEIKQFNNIDQQFKNWTEIVVDVDNFADGQSHILSIESEISTGSGPSAILIDDVSLVLESNSVPLQRYGNVQGNPADSTWTLYLSEAKADGKDLNPGDEIAIFDGNTMVGAFKLTEAITPSSNLSENAVVVWSTLNDGPGYTPGNTFTFRCLNMVSNKEYFGANVVFTACTDDNDDSCYQGENGFPENEGRYSIIKLSFNDQNSQYLQLKEGYQFISFIVESENFKLLEIMTPVLNQLEFVKNTEGKMLRKIGQTWIDGIKTVDITRGYLVKMKEDSTLTIQGTTVNPQTEIDLKQGYQFVAAYTSKTAIEAFDSITDNLVFVKDTYGKMLRKIGSTWFDGIKNMLVGSGYLVKMDQDDKLIYPSEKRKRSIENDDQITTEAHQHFPEVPGDPSNPTWSIYLLKATINGSDLEPGDEIGIFDGDKLVGSYKVIDTITSEINPDHVLIAWSVLKDGSGYQSNNSFTIKCWDASTNTEFEITNIMFSDEIDNSAYTNTELFPEGDVPMSFAELSFGGGTTQDLTVNLSSTISSERINTSNIPVTVQFSENVTGFDASDINIENGIITNFSGSQMNYSFYINPTNEGSVVVKILSDVVQGSSDQWNKESNQLQWFYDNSRPSISLYSTVSSPTSIFPIPIVVSFSETILDFTQTDIQVNNASISEFTQSNNTTYNITVIPDSDGIIQISIGENKVNDLAGNSNVASQLFEITYQEESTQDLTVTLFSTITSERINTSSIPVTVQFNEAVTGFDASDVNVYNGSITNFSGSQMNYSFNINPANEGNVVVEILSDVVQGSSDQWNKASNQLQWIYDISKPLVTISSTVSSTTSISPIPVIIYFSETILNFVKEDINVNNASISEFTQSGNTTYRIKLIPDSEGIVKVLINANKTNDLAGNSNLESNLFEVTYKTSILDIEIYSETSIFTNESPIPVNVMFKDPRDFKMYELLVQNATVTEFSGSERSYSFNLTPMSEGLVKIIIDDVSFERTFDTTPPQLNIFSSNLSCINNTNGFPVSFVFSEPVINFTLSSLSLLNASVSNYIKVSDSTYTLQVTPSAQGNIGITLPVSAITDRAGNGNLENTNSWRFDITPPKPEILLPDDLRIVPIELIIHFSEPVVQFDPESVQISNAYVSSHSKISSTEYTLSIIPTEKYESSTILISIPANIVNDECQNGNLSYDKQLIYYPYQRPLITIHSNTPEITNISPVLVTILFTNPVDDFDQSDISTTNCTITEFSGTGTQYSVKLIPYAITDNNTELSMVINENVVHNSYGMGNIKSDIFKRVFDNISPEVKMTSPVIGTTNQSTIPLAVSFDETVMFTIDSIKVTNGEVTEFIKDDEDKYYSFKINTLSQGVVHVQIPLGTVYDLAGNANMNELNYLVSVDTTKPSIILDYNALSIALGSQIQYDPTNGVHGIDYVNDSTLDITNQIETSIYKVNSRGAQILVNQVDTHSVGTYRIIYSLEDQCKNQADDSIRILEIYKPIKMNISGKVIDDSNNPVIGVKVETDPTNSPVYTDDSGFFEIPDLLAGMKYCLTFYHNQYIPITMYYENNEDIQEIVLFKKSINQPIMGKCTSNSSPVKNALIRLWSQDKLIASSLSDNDGDFTVASTDISADKITASKQNYYIWSKSLNPDTEFNGSIELIEKTNLWITLPDHKTAFENNNIELIVEANPIFSAPLDEQLSNEISLSESPITTYFINDLYHIIYPYKDLNIVISADTSEDNNVNTGQFLTQKQVQYKTVANANALTSATYSLDVTPGAPMVVKNSAHSEVVVKILSDALQGANIPEQLSIQIDEYDSSVCSKTEEKIVAINIFDHYGNVLGKVENSTDDPLKNTCLTIDYESEQTESGLVSNEIGIFHAENILKLISENGQTIPNDQLVINKEANTVYFCVDHLSAFGFFELSQRPDTPSGGDIELNPKDDGGSNCFIKTINGFTSRYLMIILFLLTIGFICLRPLFQWKFLKRLDE